VTWIKLDPSATATRAGNQHLAMMVAALISAGTLILASSQDW